MKIHFKPLVLGVLLLSSSVSFSGYSAVMTADNGGSQVSVDLAKRVAVNFMTTQISQQAVNTMYAVIV